MDNKPLYPIGVLSQLLNVHQRTLRIYDEQGLLVSSRTTKNRRLYSQNDIEKAKIITYLTRNLALNLAGVKMVLGILKELKVNPKKYMELIEKVSVLNNFDEQENILKCAKRGRKAKI
ncbi:MAG: MerR family transcriptional regulator [Candidatus Gastranaerophilales bacterium]|nr:MerR family transcriptional regulator [Candidatus Gastranaerophilales bacterium]